MRPVVVLLLLPPSPPEADTPVGWLDDARSVIADRHLVLFREAGATDVRIVRDIEAASSFGERLRRLVAGVVDSERGRQVGLVVVGGGSMPLARPEDAAAFIATTRSRATQALTNRWYSGDAVAVSDARVLLDVPDLPSDNALPRWLAERAGVPVGDLRDRARLAMDVDSPLDVLVLTGDRAAPAGLAPIAERIAAASPAVVRAIEGIRRAAADRRSELLVAGRTSAATLEWLERRTACRIRALVEERGLRASSALALGNRDDGYAPPGEEELDGPTPHLRPPRSALGLLLDAQGPAALPAIAAELADAAVIDSRVLLAHRRGADEAAWPALADRLASDLLWPDDIDDRWLRALTAAAADAPIPILLGGHTLAGPGLPYLLRGGESAR
jgi:CTP:molybdopterin cytidylyltransferase MocA